MVNRQEKNVWIANAGFLVTGVGLPLLGVLAFGFSGKDDLQSLASRQRPSVRDCVYKQFYTGDWPCYLQYQEAGNVSYEIGLKTV
ncbi:branched-chain amino acid transport system II carrier protein [Bacillus cereus]